MHRPIRVVAEGLGHPEGPDILPDGRVVFVETYTSDVKVYEEGKGVSQYAYCGGGTNACLLGSDGAVYVTQNGGTVGPWKAKDQVAPSIQKILPDGRVEVLATEVDGVRLQAPNDLAFGKDGRLYFTDPGEWDPENRPDPSRIFALNSDATGELVAEFEAAYPNGIVVEPNGNVVWVESYNRTVRRRHADGSLEVVITLPEGHIPDGFKIDCDGNFWITTFLGGVLDIVSPDGEYLDALDAPHVPLNCVFQGTTLWVTDFGPVGAVTAAAPMDGRLLAIDVETEGMEVFRGSIG